MKESRVLQLNLQVCRPVAAITMQQARVKHGMEVLITFSESDDDEKFSRDRKLPRFGAKTVKACLNSVSDLKKSQYEVPPDCMRELPK
eukprot:gene22091-8671_t